MAIVYLGIGSNIGEKKDNINNGISSLRQNGLKIHRVSTIIESEPYGGPPQDNYLNAALKAETDLTPPELLECIKDIERDLGRTPTVRWGPRIIDIDILFYDDIVLDSQTLTIPHPEIKKRDFVIKPLKEIAPEKFKDLEYAHN